MKSQAKFLPLVLFAAVLVSLVFIIPVFSASGTVRFVDSADTTKDQSWAKQGGTILLETKDSDLNVAIKRVLLPIDYKVNAATVTGSSGSALLQMSTTTNTALATATTTTSLIALGDTIVVAPSTAQTVRKVTAVNMTTGVVTVNKAFTVDPDGTISKVTQPNALADTCPDCAHAERITIVAGSSGGTATFFGLDSVPMADSGGASSLAMSLSTRFTNNADTVTNSNDLFLSDRSGNSVAATITVTFVTGSTGLINVTNKEADFAVFALYYGAANNDTGTTVKVTSNSDPTGITVALTETGPTTGIFRLSILATSSASDASASPPELQVGANDTVSIKYTDASPSQTVSQSMTIETTIPVFSNLTPADATAGQASRPEVEADVTDGDSGVKDTLVRIIFAIDSDGDGDIDNAQAPQDNDVNGSGDLTAITAGFHARLRLPNDMAPSTDATIYWWVKSTDIAGNVGISDRQVTIDSVKDSCDSDAFSTGLTGGSVGNLVGKKPGTTTDINGCQPFSIKVDFGAPTIITGGAKTGPWWDTDKTTTDKTESEVTKAKNTSILVTFSEDLDGTTVQTSDFRVAGVAPANAEWFSGAKSSVFLTVSALAADARPKVELVSEVKDVAGNIQTTGSVDLATDAIAPTITITLTGTGAGDRPVTKDKMTVKIVTNEDVGQPFVNVRKVSDETLVGDSQLGATTTPTAVLKSARTYEAEITITAAGLYNVYVRANDATAQNTGTAGKDGSAVLSIKTDTSAILFEVDTAVAAPAIGPSSTDDPDTFISIEFTDEGTEYKSGSAGAADFDLHNTVTITSATLDAVDITPLASTDDKKFLYKASDLVEGDHTVKVKAKDVAGNEKEFTGTVKVTARSDFSLPLNPGWNLVSLPGEPANAAIDTVIPPTHPVSTVLTYDPSVPGGWLTAVRGGDGNFVGTLDTISANRAYWMLTNSFEAIKVNIPRLASGAAVLPPTISIVTGWNFIPVLDVTGDLTAGATASTTGTGSYTSGLNVSRVWTFDTLNNKWKDVTGGDVAVGSGYWLFATKSGTLIP